MNNDQLKTVTLERYISSDYPNLIFSTVEAAKGFAEKLEMESYKVVEYLYLSNDENTVTLIGYALLYNGRLFQ